MKDTFYSNLSNHTLTESRDSTDSMAFMEDSLKHMDREQPCDMLRDESAQEKSA